MTPDDIAKTRQHLRLTRTQLAALMGYGSANRISEIEHGTFSMGAAAQRLLIAYAAGYRPADWPEETT